MKNIKLRGPGGFFLAALIIFVASCSIVDLDGIREKAGEDLRGRYDDGFDTRLPGQWMTTQEPYLSFYFFRDGTVSTFEYFPAIGASLVTFRGSYFNNQRKDEITMKLEYAHGFYLNYKDGSTLFNDYFYPLNNIEVVRVLGTFESDTSIIQYYFSGGRLYFVYGSEAVEFIKIQD